MVAGRPVRVDTKRIIILLSSWPDGYLVVLYNIYKVLF